MNVAESKRVRHIVLHIERGEELPVALIRALHDAEAKSASITGVGIVEAIELADIDPRGVSSTYRIDTPSLVVSLIGNVALEDGATNVHLYANIARQTDAGHQSFAGHVRWARAGAMDLIVTVFDDLVLERLTDDQGFSTTLVATVRASGGARTVVVAEEPHREPVVVAPVAVAPVAVAPVVVVPKAVAPVVAVPRAVAPAVVAPKAVVKEPEPEVKVALAPPARIAKPVDDSNDIYPEMNDLVNHFQFGDCEVVSSDGERIRLRQIKDGRVREVALEMLKIERPTIDEVTSKRSFKLARKN
jgi:predicted DNA-binding protein with PD1-like motif